MLDPELEAAAYHEAGHAVVALARRRKVEAMHLEDSPHVHGWVKCAGPPPVGDLGVSKEWIRQLWPMAVNDSLTDVAIDLGGPIAQALFSFQPVEDLIRSDSESIMDEFRRLAWIQDRIPELAGFEHIRRRDLFSAVFLETALLLILDGRWKAVTDLAEALLRRRDLDEKEIMEILDDTYTAPGQRKLFPGARQMHPLKLSMDRKTAIYRQLCAARRARDEGYLERAKPSRFTVVRHFNEFLAGRLKHRLAALEPLEWVKRMDRRAAGERASPSAPGRTRPRVMPWKFRRLKMKSDEMLEEYHRRRQARLAGKSAPKGSNPAILRAGATWKAKEERKNPLGKYPVDLLSCWLMKRGRR